MARRKKSRIRKLVLGLYPFLVVLFWAIFGWAAVGGTYLLFDKFNALQ